MKTKAALAILFTAAMAVAEPIDPIMGKPFSQLTDEEKAIRKRKIEEFQGGILMVEPSGPRYVVMDVRGKPDETPEGVAKVFKEVLKIGVDIERSAPSDKDCPMALAKKRLDANTLAVVVVVDGATNAPCVSVFPEERIAVVNAAPLGAGATAAERLRKEIWRAIGFVSGVGYSAGKHCVMQPAMSVEELDAIDAKGMNPNSLLQLNPIFHKYGVKKGTRMTYRNAVRQGIAPAPTNDLQRAVMKDELARMDARAAATNAPAEKVSAPTK